MAANEPSDDDEPGPLEDAWGCASVLLAVVTVPAILIVGIIAPDDTREAGIRASFAIGLLPAILGALAGLIGAFRDRSGTIAAVGIVLSLLTLLGAIIIFPFVQWSTAWGR